jgi:hypothetical protein
LAEKGLLFCGGEAVRWALGFKGFLYSWFKGGGPLVFQQGYFRGKRIRISTMPRNKGAWTSVAGYVPQLIVGGCPLWKLRPYRRATRLPWFQVPQWLTLSQGNGNLPSKSEGRFWQAHRSMGKLETVSNLRGFG